MSKGPNELVVIGWLGDNTCYLNIGRTEAIKRYCIENEIAVNGDDDAAYAAAIEAERVRVDVFRFTDRFHAYDASPCD